MEPISVTRSTVLETSVEDLWSLLTQEAGLSSWIGAEVGVIDGPTLATVGAVAHLDLPDGTSRRAVVTDCDQGRRVGFVWWDSDRPNDASAVQLALDETAGGVSLTVVETVPPPSGGGRTCAVACADVGEQWSGRFGALAERCWLPMPASCVLV